MKKLYKIIVDGKPLEVLPGKIATYSLGRARNKNRFLGGQVVPCEATGFKLVELKLTVKVPTDTKTDDLVMIIEGEVGKEREVISCFSTDETEEGI